MSWVIKRRYIVTATADAAPAEARETPAEGVEVAAPEVAYYHGMRTLHVGPLARAQFSWDMRRTRAHRFHDRNDAIEMVRAFEEDERHRVKQDEAREIEQMPVALDAYTYAVVRLIAKTDMTHAEICASFSGLREEITDLTAKVMTVVDTVSRYPKGPL